MGLIEDQTKPSDKLRNNLAWALKLVWQTAPGLTLANLALTIFQSVVPLLGLYLTKLVVDAVSAAITTANTTPAFRDILVLIILSAGVVFLDRTLGTILEFVRSAQTYIATDRVHEILHAKSIEVDLEYYENSDYYDALHRAQEEAPYRPTHILNGFFSFAQSGISVIALGGLLFTFHWSVPVVLILAAIPDLLLRVSVR